MKHPIHISKSVTLPVEIAGRRTAIFGISGSGKSNTATVLIEQLLAAGEQVILIDPKGEGSGLLSTAAGKPSNLDIVAFGEPNGHIQPLLEQHGPQLASFAVESGRSMILSLLGFESDASERRFAATFLRQLYRLKSQSGSTSRTLVVLDEAHLFIPETTRSEAAELSGAVQKIVRQGRSFGIGTLMIDQRPQDVSKRAITQCDTLICHQLTHKTDRTALSDWVRGYATEGQAEQFLDSLASLEPGEAWLWSPGWLKTFERLKVLKRTTFDTGAAPDGTTTKVKRAEVDLDALQKQLGEIVAKAKADDPKELRKRIAELERSLAAAGKSVAADPETLKAEYLRGAESERREWKTLLGNTVVRMKQYCLLTEKAHLMAAEHVSELTKTEEGTRESAKPKVWTGPPPRKVAPLTVKVHPSSNGHASTAAPEGITRKQQQILNALAWYESIENNDPTLTQIGAVALIDATGGYFSNVVGPLSNAGYVERGSGTMRLTEAGRKLAQQPARVATLSEYHDVLRSRIRKMKSAQGKTVAILDALIEAGGNPLTVEELGQAVGIDHTGGYFSNCIGPLSTAGVIERDRGTVRPTDVLFPRGL